MDENKWNWSSEGLKNTCSLWTRKNTFRTYSLNETASKFHLWHSDLEAKKCLRMTGMAGSMITQRGPSHLTFCQALGGSRFVKDLDKSFVTFALETAAWLSKHMRTYIWPSDTICTWSSAQRRHLERDDSNGICNVLWKYVTNKRFPMWF